MIACDAPVVVGTHRYGDSPNAARRIAGCGNRLARFFCVLNERDEKRASAHIESPLDDHRIVPWHAKDRLCSAAAHRLQLCQQRGDIVWCVFAVDDDPVEACACDDFRGNWTCETAPESNLPVAFCESLLESIAGQNPRPFGHELHLL